MAEALGTAVLVIGGCGTAVFSSVQGDVTMGLLGIATAFGLSLLIMAYTIGPISGCHINPAVTLGLVIAKKVDAGLAPFYVGGQLIGGLIGGAILWATFKMSDIALPAGFASNGYGEHSPLGFELGSVALVEVVMTAVLLLVVLGTTHAKFQEAAFGLAVGTALWVIHLISIPISNTSVNPARSLAVAPFATESWPMTQLWAFFVFPLIGGALGALIYMVVSGSDSETAVEANA